LSSAEAARALAAWPRVSEIADLLIARWPGRARGFHRIDLPELSATVDVAVMEAAAALAAWSGEADAWFLDGFAPALNPRMWDERVCKSLGRLAAPGATLASWTAARATRTHLATAGFEVRLGSGTGGKRDISARIDQQACLAAGCVDSFHRFPR